ncbi:thioredoxin family protein [bacterium]|nr:thioredoxin family protein [bacterium]
MALVESLDIPLGTTMPAFNLPSPDGALYNSASINGPKGLLVAFTCNHCPYAIAIWPRLIKLADEAKTWGINTVGINPNIHPNYPDDAPDKMKIKIKEWGIKFPYLIDESQQVAQSYKAQCTPDLYLLDPTGKLVYHGRLDDNWKEPEKVQVQELRNAMLALKEGKAITSNQKPSMGCSIKWR